MAEVLAADPEFFPLISGTGGARKARRAREGHGKSAGYRVIFAYMSDVVVLVLLDLYAKNEKENLSAADKKAIKTYLTTLRKELAEQREDDVTGA